MKIKTPNEYGFIEWKDTKSIDPKIAKMLTSPRKPMFHYVINEKENKQASCIIEHLMYSQGFITREQLENIIKDVNEGNLK